MGNKEVCEISFFSKESEHPFIFLNSRSHNKTTGRIGMLTKAPDSWTLIK